MPYLHCPQCRLTLHTADWSSSPQSCPRCEAALDNAPRSMFALPSQEHGDSYGRHRFVRRALVSTGLFRDGTKLSGDRAARNG
jgi:hypothetical protein